MGIRLSGGISGRTLVRAIIVGGLGLGLLAAALYFVARRRDTTKVSAEQAKLIDIALGSDDDAERRAASRRLAGLNREALRSIKRLRVTITTYSAADGRLSVTLPDAARRLLTDSGIAMVDADRSASDAVLSIHVCCWPTGAMYTGNLSLFTGGWAGGVLLLEAEGRPVYASTLAGEELPANAVTGGCSKPCGEACEQPLLYGLLLPLAPLLNADAVPLLLDLQRSLRYTYLSGVVALALSELSDSRAVERLVTALNRSEEEARIVVSEALGKLKDPRAVGPLIAALKDKDGNVRFAAAEALGELQDPRALDPLIAALKDNTAAWLRGGSVACGAAEALAQSKDPRALHALASALKDREACVRVAAAEALAKLGDPRAFEALIASLKEEQPERLVRKKAAKALASLKDRRALEPLFEAAMSDRNASWQAQAEIANAIVALKDPQTVDRLLVALRDSEHRLAPLVAARALGKLGDRRAVEPLLEALGDIHTFESAADALVELKDERPLERLIHILQGRVLQDESHWAKEYAAKALSKSGDRRAVEPFIAALKDSKEAVRREAASALGRLRDPRAVGPLIAALQGDKADLYFPSIHGHSTVRHAAAVALGELGDTRAVEPLRSLVTRECSPEAVAALIRLELRSRQARAW